MNGSGIPSRIQQLDFQRHPTQNLHLHTAVCLTLPPFPPPPPPDHQNHAPMSQQTSGLAASIRSSVGK